MENSKMTIEEMAVALAHEFKNPVALIKANVDYIKSCEQTDELNKNFSIINKELSRLDNIVAEFVELTKRRDTSSCEEISVLGIIKNITRDYDISLKNKSISFLTVCTDESIKIKGDFSKLCILFYNLYKNAVEAIDHDGTIITDISSSGNKIIISIQDNGKGIEEKNLALVENPFFTTKPGGSGLGLSICRNIIAEHSGDMIIHRNASGGTTVTLTL